MVDPKVVEALIAARVRAEDSPLAELTQRELEILSEIAQGKSNQAIADKLVLTKRAVEKHINAIFLKLGLTQAEDVSRRVKAALIYLVAQPPRATTLSPPTGGHPPGPGRAGRPGAAPRAASRSRGGGRRRRAAAAHGDSIRSSGIPCGCSCSAGIPRARAPSAGARRLGVPERLGLAARDDARAAGW